jgi:hypothetical protein
VDYLLLQNLQLLNNLVLKLELQQLNLEMSLMGIQHNIQKLFLQILYILQLQLQSHYYFLYHLRHHLLLLNNLLNLNLLHFLPMIHKKFLDL